MLEDHLMQLDFKDDPVFQISRFLFKINFRVVLMVFEHKLLTTKLRAH